MEGMVGVRFEDSLGVVGQAETGCLCGGLCALPAERGPEQGQVA